MTPDEVEDAFVKANPGLTRAGISVACDSRRLNEVRVCLGKDLKFQDCAEIDRRACRRDKLVMPPVRRASRTAGWYSRHASTRRCSSRRTTVL